MRIILMLLLCYNSFAFDISLAKNLVYFQKFKIGENDFKVSVTKKNLSSILNVYNPKDKSFITLERKSPLEGFNSLSIIEFEHPTRVFLITLWGAGSRAQEVIIYNLTTNSNKEIYKATSSAPIFVEESFDKFIVNLGEKKVKISSDGKVLSTSKHPK